MAGDICESLSYIVGRLNAAALYYITSEYSVLGTSQISTGLFSRYDLNPAFTIVRAIFPS